MIESADQALDSYYRHVAKKKAYEEKVERLKSAYKKLHSVYEEFRSARKSTMKVFEADGSWRGERYKEFCTAGEELESLLDSYSDRLDAAQDAINTERANLEAEIANEIPIIRDLWSMYEKLAAAAQNLVNDIL